MHYADLHHQINHSEHPMGIAVNEAPHLPRPERCTAPQCACTDVCRRGPAAWRKVNEMHLDRLLADRRAAAATTAPAANDDQATPPPRANRIPRAPQSMWQLEKDHSWIFAVYAVALLLTLAISHCSHRLAAGA
jgi:hypothetical protein